ncbi:MAG TPA: hypothetical protein VIK74_00595 [Parasegetibacter sp.]
MRILGIILIIAGILLFVFRSVSFTKKEKVLDVGPIEVSKEKNEQIGWPVYAGGIVALTGVVLLLAAQKKPQ